MSLVEVMLTSSMLVLASLSLATAFSSTGLSSRSSDQSLAVKASFDEALRLVDELPPHELISRNGTTLDRGDHVIHILTHESRLGLILVELLALDDASGRTLARRATYRSESPLS